MRAARLPVTSDWTELSQDIAAEMRGPVHPTVEAIADIIHQRHGAAVSAILFYGSCLRQTADVLDRAEGVLDLYVLVDRYRAAYTSWLSALANAVLPPNVFFVEVPWRGRMARAKYAIVSLDAFERGTSSRGFHPSLWARFAQPARLIYAKDEGISVRVGHALATAMIRMVTSVAPLLDGPSSTRALWQRALKETYRTELRTEGGGRGRQIYEADQARYERLTPLALRAGGFEPVPAADGAFTLSTTAGQRRRAQYAWFGRRLVGKPLTIFRLTKAVFTFEGGVDYALWKIERHTGIRPPIGPWERRHPVLAAPILLWRLYRLGAIH